jgi:deoxyribodipyrimidine photo-lyase
MQSGQTGINTPRMYNPVKQGRDQDPEGRFTRQWVPELSSVPLAVLQTPWLATGGDLGGYPPPIVDPVAAARVAKERLTALRQAAGYRDAALEVFQKHGSRKRRLDNDNPRNRRTASRPMPPQAVQLSLRFDD